MNQDRFSTPIRFRPIYQERVWGGRRIETILGRRLPEAGVPYGESWEISDRLEAQSVAVNGGVKGLSLNELWVRHRMEVFGLPEEEHGEQGSGRFPLLMKILDAREDLSLQVHPPAGVAGEMGGEPKTEMWYVAHAEPGARIYAGLRPGVTRAKFEEALAEGKAAECVHELEARQGDCLFLPSGRVHAIGAGLLIYEIQQNSDTTYRVFDWNRVGLDGKPRQLHVAESLRSIDFGDECPEPQTRLADGTLVDCDYFRVRLLQAVRASAMGEPGEHLTFAVVSGHVTVGGEVWRAGDFGLVPATMARERRLVLKASPEAAWLEVRLK